MIEIEGIEPMMIANNLEPQSPIHPGEIIRDELEYMGITQKKLAEEIGVPYATLNEMVNGKRPITAECALLIEAVLGVEAQMLLNIQSEYDRLKAKRNPSFAERLKHLRQIAAVL
ncbi:MAG: HigA family addiction module antitoxin [Clostridium sp.]|nr:HigA family addiction module antitoxin [Clostridium sp.]